MESLDLRIIVDKMAEKIEFISKMVHFGLTRVSFCGVTLPAIAVTATNYFVYDLKEDSYFLSVPMM